MAEDQIPSTKPCSKCLDDKALEDFYALKEGKLGRHSVCKRCMAARAAKRRQDPMIRETQKAAFKRWRENNPERLRELKREYYRRHRERIIAKSAAYQKANHEQRKIVQQKWRDRNREKVRLSQRKAREKFASTPKGRLHLAFKALINYHLKNGKQRRRTFDLVPYSLEQLMAHLERRFQPGMTWHNYGEWHVDHIIPVSAHNFECAEDIDFQRAWALSNLQPLWASDNHKKSCKIETPFQPSLLL